MMYIVKESHGADFYEQDGLPAKIRDHKIQRFFSARCAQYRGKSQYRVDFRLYSKSPVPGKLPVQGMFAQTQSLRVQENR